MKVFTGRLMTIVLMLISLVIGMLITRTTPDVTAQQNSPEATETAIPSATETIPPSTPLPSLTPSTTLRPPPTFEPPTSTVAPTLTPTVTPTTVIQIDAQVPNLRGAETATPSSTPGCKPRDDWQLTYTVQPNDTLTKIADYYGVYYEELANANCISDPNVITLGQTLRVPGIAHPVQPEYECVAWEALTPMNGTFSIEGDGPLTFNWRGPRAPINLIRIVRPDGSIYEITIELRQNEIIEDIGEMLPAAGTYTWYVFPLDSSFRQIPCREGGPWTFTKQAKPEEDEEEPEVPGL